MHRHRRRQRPKLTWGLQSIRRIASGAIVAFLRGVNESALIPAEIEAIQAAIREVPSLHRGVATAVQRPLSASSRIAAADRQFLFELIDRWVADASDVVRFHETGECQVAVVDVEIVEGATARAEVLGAWLGAARGSEKVEMLIAIHGAIIAHVASWRCGDQSGQGDQRRAPSRAALQLFEPAGRAVVQSWIDTWRQSGRTALHQSDRPSDISDLLDSGPLLRVALSWQGCTMGTCQVYIAPSAVNRRRAPMAVPREHTCSIAHALSEVPIEVQVELGSVRLTLEEVKGIVPGAVLALSSFVDSRVPISIGGVIKAWGKPVLHRGSLAVTVEQVVGSRDS
jgi:flagellar motor switch protein FliN